MIKSIFTIVYGLGGTSLCITTDVIMLPAAPFFGLYIYDDDKGITFEIPHKSDEHQTRSTSIYLDLKENVYRVETRINIIHPFYKCGGGFNIKQELDDMLKEPSNWKVTGVRDGFTQEDLVRHFLDTHEHLTKNS